MKVPAYVLWLLLVSGTLVTGCKKNKDASPAASALEDKLKDSTLLYAKDIYLWNKNIPASFNARQYDDPNAIMEAIRAYSSEPGFTGPVDRWSFAMLQTDWNNLSQGISGDFGMNVFFMSSNDLRVSYVERESPAGKAGIHRGWRIKQFNGSTNVTTGNTNAIVSAVYQSNATTFLFGRPSGADTTITLTAASYQEHPVYLDSVYTTGSKKAGYMVFSSFLGDSAEIANGFNRVFNRFSAQGVSDVIIDLRYNGGGYVALQALLANYLAPSTANGGIMATEKFNDLYSSQFNSTTYFSKKGTLNVNRVFVIVTQSTASASELLINSLKPYMDVQLVGPTPTHGKPVGFFPIPVGNWYIFPVSFRTVNKNGEGNYFNGLPLNNQVADGLDKEWGDVNESCLASTLHYIGTGSYARVMAPQQQESLNRVVQDGNNVLSQPRFKGAIEKKIAL